MYEYITNFPVIGSLKIVSDGVVIKGLYTVPDSVFINESVEEGLPEVMQQCIKELNEYFSGKRKEFTFVVSQSGTGFQERVWQELMKISYGETISYAELAKRVDNPKAVRAVGSANGKNNIIIVVPCHRVINSDGALGGYSAGGVENKKFLLDLEKTHK